MTRKEAIDAMCRQCQGCGKGGDYDPIRDCSATNDQQHWSYCPLWEWRIGSEKRKKEVPEELKKEASKRMKSAKREGGRMKRKKPGA